MNQNPAAVVLAGGLGTRMKSDTPKHFHPILGRRMVDWVVEAARAGGGGPAGEGPGGEPPPPTPPPPWGGRGWGGGVGGGAGGGAAGRVAVGPPPGGGS